MKNFTDPIQLSCQNLILKRLESQEVRYLMHQKKWLKNSILVLGVFMKYGIIVSVSNKGLFYLPLINLLWIRRNRLFEVVSEVSSISLSATEIPKKNGRKKKVKIDEKPVTE